MSAEEIRELVAKSRREQGLPPVIADPATLDRVATLLQEPSRTAT